jgi:hypothetical protein
VKDVANVLFILYLLISVVSGVLSAVRKRSQTTPPGRRQTNRRRVPSRPVVVSEPVRPVIELPPTPEPEAEEAPMTIELDSEGGDLSTGGQTEFSAGNDGPPASGRLVVPLEASWTLVSDLSGSLDEEIGAEGDGGLLDGVSGRDMVHEVAPRHMDRAQAHPVARLLADRDQLRSAVVAMEVLGKPKALRM